MEKQCETQQAIVAICGTKNTGKTTMIEALLPLLAEAGVRTAVIKHHGHALDPDVPGTDTWRFFQAGALGTAITDDRSAMIVRRDGTGVDELRLQFPGADLILLEGYKDSDYPKIWMPRDDVEGVLCEVLRYVAEAGAGREAPSAAGTQADAEAGASPTR